jgi:hypothetical protein
VLPRLIRGKFSAPLDMETLKPGKIMPHLEPGPTYRHWGGKTKPQKLEI